jgi:protein import protein ZIM17
LSSENLPPAPHAPQIEHSTSLAAPSSSQQLPVEEARMSLTFTCTVPNCSERSSHQFTKRAYERGIVLVTCPKCKNRCVDLVNLCSRN